jgi:hypothetical protein
MIGNYFMMTFMHLKYKFMILIKILISIVLV